jgi:chromosome segregation ATPase
LPTEKLQTKRDHSTIWEHDIQDQPSYHSKTVFSTNSSAESLQQYYQQHQQEHEAATTQDLLNENLSLVQKNALAQQEAASARNNQARLENQVYELDKSLTEARREAQRLFRAKKDFDRQLEQNNANFERERVLWAEREAELVRSVKFATRPLIVHPPAKGMLVAGSTF